METYKIEIEAYSEEQLLKEVKAEYKKLKRRRHLGVKLSRWLYRLLNNWGFAIWLLISINITTNFDIWTWQMWFIYLPTVILVGWYKNYEPKAV